MKILPQISDAEFEVMNIIWKYEPINTNDIVAYLSKDKDWSPKTIQTMLFRLEKKGVVAHEREGRIFVYSSLIEKKKYMESEGRTFVKRFFEGAFGRMAVNFLKHQDLSDEDISELQSILDKKREELLHYEK